MTQITIVPILRPTSLVHYSEKIVTFLGVSLSSSFGKLISLSIFSVGAGSVIASGAFFIGDSFSTSDAMISGVAGLKYSCYVQFKKKHFLLREHYISY